VSNNNQIEVDNQADINLLAGTAIDLMEGFSTNLGAEFDARIEITEPCSTPGAVFFKNSSGKVVEKNVHKEKRDGLVTFAYPNPTSDFITLGCVNRGYKKANIKVANLHGKVLLVDKINDISSRQMRKVIDVSDFPAGTYIYSIIVDNTILSSKFIKE
jgi:hypothetical protein